MLRPQAVIFGIILSLTFLYYHDMSFGGSPVEEEFDLGIPKAFCRPFEKTSCQADETIRLGLESLFKVMIPVFSACILIAAALVLTSKEPMRKARWRKLFLYFMYACVLMATSPVIVEAFKQGSLLDYLISAIAGIVLASWDSRTKAH